MGKYGNHEREDKSVLTMPRCPFCNKTFEPPVEIETRLSFFTGGQCSCGAVYCFDASGKNMGEAFIDALTYLCTEDKAMLSENKEMHTSCLRQFNEAWDRAMSLESDVDYEEIYLSYNPGRHSLQPNSKRVYSKDIVFIRLKT